MIRIDGTLGKKHRYVCCARASTECIALLNNVGEVCAWLFGTQRGKEYVVGGYVTLEIVRSMLSKRTRGSSHYLGME